MTAACRHCRRWLSGMLAALAAATATAADPQTDGPAAARSLLQSGKYAEAEEAYAALVAQDPQTAAVGVARAQEAIGQGAKAVQTLTAARDRHPDSPGLHAELGRLALVRGDYAAAQSAAAAAVKLEPEHALGLLVQADLAAAAGRLDDANALYERLVKRYNTGEVRDVESLRWIGLAAAQFARWNRLSDQFSFLVNEFYPELLAADPASWQAHYETGRLFAEKYNLADATKSLQAAAAINPAAAEVQAALGQLALDGFELSAAEAAVDRALEINPQLLAAWHLKADIYLANFEPRRAALVLSDALKLHPTCEATLGRLAAAYAAVDGTARTGAQTRFGRLVAEVEARNPHAGEFYLALADSLDRLRRWPAAAEYYREAARRMPQLVRPAGQLGLVLMRLGDEAAAKTALEAAFQADPFNVRVNNSLKVLEVLAGYETLETEHFLIRFDPAKDKLLARYMGEWLEQVYPRLVEQMGFSPPEKSLFEVFSASRNTDGHGWFSARMVGLPRIHPIGACAGKVVALKSPSDGVQRFNWARVLQHEFIHVINLQQTDFNIPHWFTEALAVWNEGYPRPQAWTELLVKAARDKKLFNLETINLGFIRPHSSDEWTLAYCQAELYAEYLLDRFGQRAIAALLAAYADNLTTPEAIERCFGVTPADFEQGYSAFVDRVVQQSPVAVASGEADPAEAQRALAADPRNPQTLARAAQSQLARKNYAEARRLADRALELEARQPLAGYVRARLHLLVGEDRQALDLLEASLDRQRPQENVLALLAGLKLKAEDFPAAIELYELGARHDPANDKWHKALAAVYLRAGRDGPLAELLARLAAADPDDLTLCKKLVQLALARRDWPQAARWALEGIHIQVQDVELHRGLAEALAAQGYHAAAAHEYAVAVELEPAAPQHRLALARAYAAGGRGDKARETLAELLRRHPDHPEARELSESLR